MYRCFFFSPHMWMSGTAYPAIHFAFPPSAVAFLGEDLDGVSFLQRQLWAIPGWEVVPGSGYAHTLQAASCQATLKPIAVILLKDMDDILEFIMDSLTFPSILCDLTLFLKWFVTLTELYRTWSGVGRGVCRVAFFWLFERRAQNGVQLLKVLLQRVLLVKLNQLLQGTANALFKIMTFKTFEGFFLVGWKCDLRLTIKPLNAFLSLMRNRPSLVVIFMCLMSMLNL